MYAQIAEGIGFLFYLFRHKQCCNGEDSRICILLFWFSSIWWWFSFSFESTFSCLIQQWLIVRAYIYGCWFILHQRRNKLRVSLIWLIQDKLPSGNWWAMVCLTKQHKMLLCYWYCKVDGRVFKFALNDDSMMSSFILNWNNCSCIFHHSIREELFMSYAFYVQLAVWITNILMDA